MHEDEWKRISASAHRSVEQERRYQEQLRASEKAKAETAKKLAFRSTDPIGYAIDRLRATANAEGRGTAAQWHDAGRKWATDEAAVDRLEAVASTVILHDDDFRSLGCEVVARQTGTENPDISELYRLNEAVTGKCQAPALEDLKAYLAGIQEVWTATKDRL